MLNFCLAQSQPRSGWTKFYDKVPRIKDEFKLKIAQNSGLTQSQPESCWNKFFYGSQWSITLVYFLLVYLVYLNTNPTSHLGWKSGLH